MREILFILLNKAEENYFFKYLYNQKIWIGRIKIYVMSILLFFYGADIDISLFFSFHLHSFNHESFVLISIQERLNSICHSSLIIESFLYILKNGRMGDFYLFFPFLIVRYPHKNCFPITYRISRNRDFSSKDTYILE
jgi:hypothetical protein